MKKTREPLPLTKKSLERISQQLERVLAEGNLTIQLAVANGELEALTSKEYEQFEIIMGHWRLQLEDMRTDK